MSEANATIQFAYDLQAASQDGLIAQERFADLAAWRSILFAQDLMGQYPEYNDGFSFGNLSCRASADGSPFFITGSQTTGVKRFTREHLVRISDTNLERFWAVAEGDAPPSRDTMTHAAIYASDQRIQFVFHVHSAEIWQLQSELNLPEIEAPPGSVDAIRASLELLANNQSRPLVFIERESTNSVFAIGHHARDCGGLIITYLAKARALTLTS